MPILFCPRLVLLLPFFLFLWAPSEIICPLEGVLSSGMRHTSCGIGTDKFWSIWQSRDEDVSSPRPLVRQTTQMFFLVTSLQTLTFFCYASATAATFTWFGNWWLDTNVPQTDGVVSLDGTAWVCPQPGSASIMSGLVLPSRPPDQPDLRAEGAAAWRVSGELLPAQS